MSRYSQSAKRAVRLYNEHRDVLDRISKKLVAILDDEFAHFSVQPGDGLVVVWGDAHNSRVEPHEVGNILKLSRDALIEELESRGI